MFIERLKKKFNIDEPIFTSEILSLFQEYTRAYVFGFINEAKAAGELVQFDNGVYYIPKKTIFGLSTITADDVIRKKYVQNQNDVYGLYSGIKLQNFFSVTTQMPNTVEVVTNRETTRCRQIEIDGRKFILRKSRIPITRDNVNAYTVLQFFSELGNQPPIDDWARKRVLRFIRQNNVSAGEILNLSAAFPAQAAKNLIQNGVLNEIA